MNIFILKDKNNTSAGYIQVTEEELQVYKKNSEEKVYLINLGHSIMETDEANFRGTSSGYRWVFGGHSSAVGTGRNHSNLRCGRQGFCGNGEG